MKLVALVLLAALPCSALSKTPPKPKVPPVVKPKTAAPVPFLPPPVAPAPKKLPPIEVDEDGLFRL